MKIVTMGESDPYGFTIAWEIHLALLLAMGNVLERNNHDNTQTIRKSSTYAICVMCLALITFRGRDIRKI